MRRLLCLALVVLTVRSAAAGDYRFTREVAYRPDSTDAYVSRMCRLDVAAPEGAHDAPVVVWFHGGGLTGGRRAVPEALCTEGLVVVGVGYRLSPEVATERIVDDAAAAVAWVFDHIDSLGGSPRRIYLAGHSAGGYLVTRVALDRTCLARYGRSADSLAGVISYSGQTITHFETRRGRGMTPLQPLVDVTAPLYHVRGDAPPMLLLTGDRERELYGRYEENAYFWRMLRLTGHGDVTLYELGGYGHDMTAPGHPLAVRFVVEHERRRAR